VRPTYS